MTTSRLDIDALVPALTSTCEPLAQARMLPSAVYTADAILALEYRALFARQWLPIARAEDFPAMGSFVTREIASACILVVRDAAGALRAFHNVCRHRGARLVTEARGQLRSAIACPYHAWSYGLDGRLLRAPHMDVAGQEDALALAGLPLVTRDGFVFVKLDAEAGAPPALPDMSGHGLERLRSVRTLDYTIECNWKLVCENYSECYHCPGVHPQLHRLSDLSGEGFEDEPGYNGGPMQLRPGFDTLSMSGRSDWERLGGDSASEPGLIHYYLIYPNLMLGIHPDYLLTHRVWPLAPGRSQVECELFVSPQTAVAPGLDAADVIDFWDLTNRQDWALCERVQAGVSSLGYRPGPYHPRERCVHAFDRWYAKWLLSGLNETP